MKASIASLIAALTLIAMPMTAQAQEDAPVKATDGQIVVTDVALKVSGEQVEHLSPGVSTDVTLTLRNDGEDAVRDGTLTLEGFGDGVKIEPREIALDDIGPGDRVRAAFTVQVTRQGCYEPLGLGASIREGDTYHYIQAEIPSVCPGSKMAFWTVRYEGGDGDDVPEPGEELDVYVTLRNDGRDPGRDLDGILTSPTDGVRILDGKSSWPDIAKGDEVVADDPFRIAIGKDVETSKGCGYTDGGPVTDGDRVVTSEEAEREGTPPDAPTSDDGGSTSGGGSSGSQGTGEPAETSSIEPMPAEDGTIEPDPNTGEEPAREPSDPSAMFELRLSVQGADTDLVADIGSGPICAYQEDAARTGATGGGDDLAGAPEALSSEAASSNAGLALFAGALLVVVGAGSVFARRYFSATQ